MVFDGVQTGVDFDPNSAMRTVYGIHINSEYSSFSKIQDMASAKRYAGNEKSDCKGKDRSRYHSFAKLMEE